MAVANAMFLFEVVVGSVQSYVKSRALIIKSDFGDIFSLELKDPKQMHIVIPEPPPLPPDPPGKKKAKPKKPPKKGKKGKVEAPPPEPCIQSGQSVLFSSTAEFIVQTMKKFPMELSLWSKEDNLVFIGSNSIPWDDKFFVYLEEIYNFKEPEPITVKDDYNIFEEGTAKLMAKLDIQIKLSHLGEKVTTAFRTLSEDPTVKKCLYTGINSKTTSYICTLKTTDEAFEENCNKIKNNFTVDKPKPANKIVYADYKNAPGANLPFFSDGDYCCMGHADKPPDSIYKAPETCPDIDHIIEYVRKIIVSCNDNMRMLTPRPAIRPRVKATDIDRLCYCKETSWPEGELAERFKNDAQSGPCPVCIHAGNEPRVDRPYTFDIANIRGPCGRFDCRIARDMRAYIEKLVTEDNQDFDLNELIGPCGSRTCTLARKIQEFIRHEGVFKEGVTQEGLSTQCACIEKMQSALAKKSSCDTICSKDCKAASSSGSSSASRCEGPSCPFNKKKADVKVYNVYYFTVEHDFESKSAGSTPGASTPNPDKYKYCSSTCPSAKPSGSTTVCSKNTCSSAGMKQQDPEESICPALTCPGKPDQPLSPADSDVIINFEDIRNPCCVKTCDVHERIKSFIVDGVMSKKRKTQEEDNPCYCDCVCTFKFDSKTTYCGVCGGYECLGEDMKDQPEYVKPHPCPVYHKLYDRNYIKTPNPWPEEEKKFAAETGSTKSSKTVGSRAPSEGRRLTVTKSTKNFGKTSDKREEEKTKKKQKEQTKKVGKFTANVEKKEEQPPVEKKPETKYPYPLVPKHMGWNWTAEDIPGMKPRPNWKPGAANKILVRKYRAIREGVDVIAKKKRALMNKKKKQEMKPTLVVKKIDGEYTVQMEVFKKYSKERLPFQYPYEEKPPLIYTIGKTEEEKMKIQKQRERRERRETRRKSRLLQSTFRDKCQEICLKAYNQAIGLLPLPNPNDPECPCFTEPAQNLSPPIDSCSCSEEGTISSSDTDGDEWTIEFTPPAARFDPKAKHPPVLCDNESQYTYLDYKVKVLDKNGNQVPRFFKGPDGKQVCSDLGGFWGLDKQWLEINKDGYIGPDNRWVPMNFIGPDGMFYSAEEGSFTDNNGQFLKIGIDGYIDKDGKWAWYSRKRVSSRVVKSNAGTNPRSNKPVSPIMKRTGKDSPPGSPTKKVTTKATATGSPTRGSGRGSAKPAAKGKVANTIAQSGKKALVMSMSVNYDRNPQSYASRQTLKVDPNKLAKYREIMNDLQMYDEFCEVKSLCKSTRACNTYNTNPRKKPQFTNLMQVPSCFNRSDSPTCSSNANCYLPASKGLECN